MLQLDFINVGDGDSVLVREFKNKKVVFTLLVDCGRLDLLSHEGSKRIRAADYLKEQGVTGIDLLIITHLHQDHFGGMRILDGIAVTRMISCYLPAKKTMSVLGKPGPESSASTVGLYRSLSDFIDCFRRLESTGCVTEPAVPGSLCLLTDRLSMQIGSSDQPLLDRQKKVLRAIEAGENLPESTLYAVSKERNPSSLRIALSYAGRRILLPGDAYGAYWDSMPDAIPCDILKLPHHGDEKSLSNELMRKLRPAHAVITGMMNNSVKHRPAAETLRLLKRWKARITSLENDAVDGLPEGSFKSAVFTIRQSGRIKRRMKT